MPNEINSTHDPELRSWLDSANAPGTDFPINGEYGRTPSEVHAEVLNQQATGGGLLNTSPNVVVQINHIGSHFGPLAIDTSVEPPASFLPDPTIFRLDPAVPNFFHHFPVSVQA